LEGVEVYLNFTGTRGDLTAGITSPYTTKSRLFNVTTHFSDPAQQDDKKVTDFGWTFLSNAFWGEDPLGGTDKTSGTWTITMGDRVNNGTALWNSYGITLLMGKLILNDAGTTTQMDNIKASSLTMKNSDELFINPSGKTLQVSEKIHITGGELNVNGLVKMSRPEDDESDGEFILDGGTVSGGGTIDAPYGFYHTAGTIQPGNSIGTLTINGDYYQEPRAKLLIEVASSTSNDVIAINGSADLQGVLQTSWTGGATPAIGTASGTFLTATGGVTGRFSSLLTNITPTVVFNPRYDVPNQVYLVVERNYANQTLFSYLTTNQKAVGTMLNILGSTATGDLNTVLGSIDALTAYGQVANAYDQLAPRGDVAISGMALSSTTFHSGNIANRLTELRSGSSGFSLSGLRCIDGDLFKRSGQMPILLANSSLIATDVSPAVTDEKWGVFVKGSAIFGDQKNSSEQLGYRFTNTGVTLGMDYRFTHKLIAGLMAGINTSRAKLDDYGSQVKMDSFLIGTYGTYFNRGFFVDGQVGYGSSNYDNTRRIVFPGLDRTATSSPRGEQFSAYGGTGYDVPVGNWLITPVLSVQYTWLAVDRYTEAGADSLNLQLNRRTTTSLQSNAGGKLSYLWETGTVRVIPNIHAAYVHEFSNDSQAVTARLAQFSIPFETKTPSPQRDFAMAGAGITGDFKNGMSLYMNYDAQIRQNDFFAHGIHLGLRIQF
jgi:outer membrane autotransporter protein